MCTKAKGSKQDSQNRLRSPICSREENLSLKKIVVIIIIIIQWNLCNPTPEFFDNLWHTTNIYGPKVFLLTKIKLSIPTSCPIWHISLVSWCVGLDRFHCNNNGNNNNTMQISLECGTVVRSNNKIKWAY